MTVMIRHSDDFTFSWKYFFSFNLVSMSVIGCDCLIVVCDKQQQQQQKCLQKTRKFYLFEKLIEMTIA